MMRLTSVEICAGAGGQALGLERAHFEHIAAVEVESVACETLLANRPLWNVINRDVRQLDASAYKGVDLFAGGVPCPPFSIASKQLGAEDARDLFPVALDLVEEVQPKAVLLENVPGLAAPRFAAYRVKIRTRLEDLGFRVFWQPINAKDFGVPQLRPRFVLVALKREFAGAFRWPAPTAEPPTVGEVLFEQMASRGWTGARDWARRANRIAPTLVGGSKLHGGPDLGPTRSRQAWAELGVDGLGVANEPPDRNFPSDGRPKLTVQMAALLQGFPPEWRFSGKKTAQYRQVGNAFPPPVAAALGNAIRAALAGETADDVAGLFPLAKVG